MLSPDGLVNCELGSNLPSLQVILYFSELEWSPDYSIGKPVNDSLEM